MALPVVLVTFLGGIFFAGAENRFPSSLPSLSLLSNNPRFLLCADLAGFVGSGAADVDLLSEAENNPSSPPKKGSK